MEFDPHTLHAILKRIEQQMRCPQCAQRMQIPLTAVRMTGDDFVLLQLKCPSCSAYIVLHASLKGVKELPGEDCPGVNVSSSLCEHEIEISVMRDTLQGVGGSFQKLFEKEKAKKEQKKA
jgi:DNA-directed RNA polymerase subunit RPC12/RpoP